ncbi:merR family regulatory protein [Roseovarius sp. A-2]|uniref:MerR family transcriptional regulator n=1 Tax=Roseovarius sp. A-2 TaxID=1570360 RepID=UPI0009B57948|nr:MerR family transcriptional regulator [Roseovarius sp. A-2]GAW35640.1 merR family regulatory protein [Roseovarius sp. A-2]
MAKSADAFRTISEVAEWLEVPAHVLRFWESKFTQIKPVKRAGGRRYYRPSDMRLLGGIKALLHDEGMTIKGVQKLLREEGVRHVAALSQYLDDGSEDKTLDMATPDPAAPAQVLAFERPGPRPEAESAAPEDMTGDDAEDTPTPTASADTDEGPDARPFETIGARPASESDPEAEAEPEVDTATPVETAPEPDLTSPPENDTHPDPPPVPEDTPPDNIFADDIADRPQADSEQEHPEPQAEPSDPAAPSLPPLPDLPADPADDLPGAPGALSALAALKHPVSRDLAAELSGLSNRLRTCAVKKDANDVSGT